MTVVFATGRILRNFKNFHRCPVTDFNIFLMEKLIISTDTENIYNFHLWP